MGDDAEKTALHLFGLTYPREIPRGVTDGQVLVHNHVRPARHQGARGFRFWLQEPDATLDRCECDWAPEVAEHYIPGRLKWNDMT